MGWFNHQLVIIWIRQVIDFEDEMEALDAMAETWKDMVAPGTPKKPRGGSSFQGWNISMLMVSMLMRKVGEEEAGLKLFFLRSQKSINEN